MLRRLALATLLLGLVSCKCDRKPGPTPGGAPEDLTRLLPRSADAVVVVPDLGALGKKISVLEGLKASSFAAQLQGLPDARGLASALMREIGIDLRSPEALAAAGVDPGRALGVALLPDRTAYSVVPVKDEEKLEQTLLALSKQRLGAGVLGRKTEAGSTVVTFSRGEGAPPALGFVVKDRFALVAAAESVSKLPGFAALPAADSLAKESALAASLARLPKERDLWVHLPAGSSLSRQGVPAGTTVAACVTEKAFTLTADVPWAKEILALLAKKDGPDLFGHLPPDAFLLARFSFDPKLLAPYWAKLAGARLERAFGEGGFDVKAEVLENMRPGATVAVSLAPEVRLGAGMPTLDLRQTNPFRYLHLTAVAQAHDAEKMGATLEKLPAVAPRFGARIAPEERNGKRVFVTSYSQGEGLHFARAGDKAVFGAPLGRLEQLLALAAEPKGGPISDPALRRVFSERAAAVVIDLRRLSDSVRELPSSAWGIGGFAIKATTVRWLDATDDLRAVVLALDAKEGALQAELSLQLEPKGARAEGGGR